MIVIALWPHLNTLEERLKSRIEITFGEESKVVIVVQVEFHIWVIHFYHFSKRSHGLDLVVFELVPCLLCDGAEEHRCLTQCGIDI